MSELPTEILSSGDLTKSRRLRNVVSGKFLMDSINEDLHDVIQLVLGQVRITIL